MKIPIEKELQLYQEYNEISGREPNPRLYQEMVKRYQGKIKVLALDLEWTLILNADIPHARSGLFEFLKAVKSLFERVVIFTAVKRDKFQEVAKVLVTAGDVPEWFVNIEYIEWPRKGYKNLSFIPGIKPHEALIVDDQRGYIHPDQLFQWVWIQEMDVCLNPVDSELSRVLGVLEIIQSGSIDQDRILNALTEYIDSPRSGIKRAWICSPLARGRASADTILDLVIEIDDLMDAEWIRKRRNRGVFKVFTHSWLFLTFWVEIKVTLLDDLSEPPANAIIIINTWEHFSVDFNRVKGGIEISFPDLEGCQGFCPDDGSILQAIEPAKDALRKWLQTAGPEDIPQKRIAPKFPFTVSGRLPWRKNA